MLSSSPIRTKFEYNNFGELVQKQGSPRVLRAEPAPSPQQFLQNGYYHKNISNDSIKNKQSHISYQDQYEQSKKNNIFSDKPNNIAFNPINYQQQFDRLYGQRQNGLSQDYKIQNNASTFINQQNSKQNTQTPFQRASQDIIKTQGINNSQSVRFLNPNIQQQQQQQNKNIFQSQNNYQNYSQLSDRLEQYNDKFKINGNKQIGQLYASQEALKKDPQQVDLSNQYNGQHLYSSELYKNLRHEYTNLNLRSHLDKIIKTNDILDIGDKKRFFANNNNNININNNHESIILNDQSLKNSMDKFNYAETQNELQKYQQEKKGDSLTILQRENRQYALSENDSVNSMMNLSYKLRQMKDLIRSHHDPNVVIQLRKAIQRRILSKNNHERKQKLISLLGQESRYPETKGKYSYQFNYNS